MHRLLFTLSNPVGIIGVILLLIAYFFLSTGRWTAHSYSFQISNCIGAALILFSLFFHWNLASFLIELAWIVISLIGMYRIFIFKKKKLPI